MQFRVPQFIEIEDKLFGPFTFKQFVYLAGGAGLVYVLYKLLPLWLAIIPIVVVGGLAGLLTFYKINNRPFSKYLQSGINYFISSKLYIWKQRLIKPGDKNKEEDVLPEPVSVLPKVSADSIKDLSWSLDIEDKK